MVIVTSISPFHTNDQIAAVKSWHPFAEIFSLNKASEVEQIKNLYEGVTFVETDKTIEYIVGRPLVKINAFIDFAIERGDDLFIVNSDIIIKDLPELRDDGITTFSRYDFVDDIEKCNQFKNGFDAFFIPNKFLKIFPQSIFAIGAAFWDYWLPIHAIRNDIPVFHPAEKYAYHKMHSVHYSLPEWNYLAQFFAWEFKINLMNTTDAGRVATNSLAEIKINLNKSKPIRKGKIDIFIKTYYKDFKLLKYALKSIIKNVVGYNKLILVVPESDKEQFENEISELPQRTAVSFVKEYGNGYLFQQLCKLNAHKYSDAEFILFSDSDCIFNYPIELTQFVADGKPEILFTDYQQIEDAQIWQQPTSELLGEHIQYEYMRRNGLVYHRSTLENLHKWKPDLEKLIMDSEMFSEFNLLGAYAFKFENDKYNFVNTDNWQYVPAKMIQLWSHYDKEGSEVHVEEYNKVLKTINEALELNLTEI